MPPATDLNLTPKETRGLASVDALAAFFTALGYDTGARTALTAESIGLSGDSATPILGDRGFVGRRRGIPVGGVCPSAFADRQEPQ